MESFVFNIGKTKAYAAIAMRKIVFGFIGYGICVLIAVPFTLYAVWTGDISRVVIVLALEVWILLVLRAFRKQILESDTLPVDEANAASYCTFDLIGTLAYTKELTALSLLEAAAKTKRGSFMLTEMGIEPEALIAACKERVNTEVQIETLFPRIVEWAKSRKDARITAALVLGIYFYEVPCCKELLYKADLSEDDVLRIVDWENHHDAFTKKAGFLAPETLIEEFGSIGRSWVMGYTNELDQLTKEMYGLQKHKFHTVIHRESIDQVLHILSRSSQHNALIMGNVGVGKKSLVRNAAVELRAAEVRSGAGFTRVLELQTEQLLSGIENPDTFLLKAFEKTEMAGKFLLVVSDLSLILRSQNENLKAVFMKFLKKENIALLATLDTQDYHALVKTNPALDSLFEKVELEDTSDEQTMNVLMEHYFTVKDTQKITCTYKALKTIISLTKSYVGKGGFPGKAIDVFNDAMLVAKKRNERVINDAHIREIVSLKSKVNVQEVSKDDKAQLLSLEEHMNRSIIGQQKAVSVLVNALKRARLQIGERKRPIGTFLFLGPTGVGKTQTAKVLAREYFGSEDSFIRMDMNEFNHADSVFGIIGSKTNAGYTESMLAKKVQDRPHSLVLLDEIEKAHPNVLNLFLQILDEGLLEDAYGNKTNFKHTIIIATSNAGALFMRDLLAGGEIGDHAQMKEKVIDSILKDKLFSPEFINRFDEVILYESLTRENAAKVAMLMVNEIVADIQRKRGITVTLAEDVMELILDKGFNPQFGARELRRTVTEVLENYLADYLLKTEVARGAQINITRKDIES